MFTIIKLFRLVNLTVESKGFCLPRECEQISPNPCEFFERLEFPLNIFEPPSQPELRSEFLGISEREEREDKREDRKSCRCDR